MNTDRLESLDRARLAQLAREYMLAAQFNSRTGYAALRINHGDEAYKDVAIDNWMAASPVYTRRMQAAMGLRGASDVETILKGMQLECGLSHQYFDACFRMVGEEAGEFWLRRCGPLLETEPRGEAAVRLMCHDIEDPTFDATAVATNPRARVRPIHRPPRVPPDREPHCHWRVVVEPGAEPIAERDITRTMAGSRLHCDHRDRARHRRGNRRAPPVRRSALRAAATGAVFPFRPCRHLQGTGDTDPPADQQPGSRDCATLRRRGSTRGGGVPDDRFGMGDQ